MSAQPNDGGPAFPQVETTVHMTGSGEDGYTPLSDVHSVGGMTLRDYFIAHAPATEIADLIPSTADECARLLGVLVCDYNQDHYLLLLAKMRRKWADAMLAARGETP